MVAVEEIVDNETFIAWLEEQPEEHRRDIAVALATRCALRVFPVWGAALHQDWARDRDLTGYPVFRRLFLTGVACKTPTPVILNATAALTTAALTTAADTKAAFAHAAANNANAAATYARAAANAVANGANTAATAADSNTAFCAAYAAADANTAVGVDIWTTLRMDIAAMEQGQDLMQRRLWSDDIPGPMVRSWRSASGWFARTPGHEFIRHWYNALVAARPLTRDWDSHWKMLEEIALIDPKDWDKGETSAGAVELAAIIAEIEEKYKTPPKPQIKQTSVNLDTSAVVVQQAMRTNRLSLPPTFDAIFGHLELEIQRLQGINDWPSIAAQEDARDLAQRLRAMAEAVDALRTQVEALNAEPSLAEAEQVKSTWSTYLELGKNWPHDNAPEIVDGAWRAGLVGLTFGGLTLCGVAATPALGVAGLMFGTKKIIEAAKAAKEIRSSLSEPVAE